MTACIRAPYDPLWCRAHAADFPSGARACYAGYELRAIEAAERTRHVVRACPCECNRGGFCGGCGHAGCTGGINLR